MNTQRGKVVHPPVCCTAHLQHVRRSCTEEIHITNTQYVEKLVHPVVCCVAHLLRVWQRISYVCGTGVQRRYML